MEKRYDFTQVETKIQEFWERQQIYKFDPSAEAPAVPNANPIHIERGHPMRHSEIYSIDTPPPTVSGTPHIGHLFSYTQAEMIARFKRMQGYTVFYPFGFDDNGLPTERLAEREEGIRAKDLPRSEFIEKCKSVAGKYETQFKEFWKSLGFSVDWSLQYETISGDVGKISQELFLELVNKNKAYMKESPVLWCTECLTSIAQAELDTVDIDSTFNYINFIVNEKSFIVDGKSLIVATTRPELLYGCVCLFVNPDDKRYQPYIGKTAIVPLYNYEIPILADDKVGMDKGTGVVMCATFGDSTDTEWVEEYDLPYRKVISPDGKIDSGVPFISGMKIIDARKEIVRLLDEAGSLQKSEKIVHAAPVHERCGKEIEIIPSRQWYIDILSEKEQFLKAADRINWYPAYMKNRYIAWVENLKWDWCISRQRYFGVPFPVWYCKDCKAPLFASPEQLPVNPAETNYDGVCKCGCKEFMPEKAVFDTWATSSVTPQINERLNIKPGIKLTPMSMRTHAHEIIRTWTFYTIVRSLYHTGDIPWKDLMINGFVLAKKGEKFSKSKNNSNMSPTSLIAEHSADALRYWSANARLGTDTFFDVSELEVAKRFITKLWNASKFTISHLQDLTAELKADFKTNIKTNLMPVDRWMIERTNETIIKAAEYLNVYEIGSARHEIDDLFWKDFCDNYIEIVKSRLYNPEIHGAAKRRSGQYALYYTLLNILKMYNIYVPHITEYIYKAFFEQHEKVISINFLQWENPKQTGNDILNFGKCLKNAISDMRKYKSENNLSMPAEMDIFEIKCEPEFVDWFLQTEKDLRACSNAKEIRFLKK